MTATQPKIKRVVMTSESKGNDLEVHVSQMTVGKSETYIDIRDYVPSTKTYGRGVVLPMSLELLAHVGWQLVNLSEAMTP